MVRTLATETVSLPTSHISPSFKHSVYPSTIFFSLTPLDFFFFFEDSARQRAALPWQRRHPEFRRQEKVHIEVKLSLQEQKIAPLQALEVGLKGQASVTLRKKAFFFFVTDVTKQTNRKIDMVNERTASTHLLRRLAFQTGRAEAAKHCQPIRPAQNKTAHNGGVSPSWYERGGGGGVRE